MVEDMRNAEFLEICLKFPLAPIEDETSYRAAVEILDRLFTRDEPRTPDESDFFRALAELAAEYESKALIADPRISEAMDRHSP